MCYIQMLLLYKKHKHINLFRFSVISYSIMSVLILA